MGSQTTPAYAAGEVETDVLAWWKKHQVFERSVREREGRPLFRFLEGPPTANGLPHPGHVLTRTLKDSVCRYQSMRGHQVPRKGGWDCHGLPVEIEVEKELGLKNKQDIEAYGVDRFNQKCRQSVFRYRDEWVQMSERVGMWLDFDDAYVTLTNEYIESVWWSLKQAWDKGLLDRGHRVTPHCPRCGTALSSHEVAQGYKDIEEPSVFVKFRRAGTENEYFLAWTTTPWTLPGNVALAVGQDIEYVTVEQETRGGTERYTLARACLGQLRGDHNEVAAHRGSELVGIRYEPLLPYLSQHLETEIKAGNAPMGSDSQQKVDNSWQVYAADFVTTEDGTGIVHTAAMYGEDDYVLCTEKNTVLYHTVGTEGAFHDWVGPYAGTFVKDADPDIVEDLRKQGLLYRVKSYTHSYPFCWRCDTPLLYYARDSWFLRMTKLRDNLVAHNSTVRWMPDHIRDGRFGEFVGNVRDWALSRDRYWGTPLPVWTCAECGTHDCVGSIEGLVRRAGPTVAKARDDGSLDLHKPHIDEITWDCKQEGCSGMMVREPSVIDTWYDSGAAHFAQWHHPFDTADEIGDRSPVDFIAEGIDQTRGWFYSLLATSTILFDRPAYRNVVVNGLVLAEDGQKMSKSKRNYSDPAEIFEKYGADAMRWSLLSSSAPWADKRFGEGPIRDAYTRFILTLWNTYQFFETYRHLDAWEPSGEPEAPTGLDRWLASRRATLVRNVTAAGDAYEYHKATRQIESFLVDDVSNWWLRRSRRRFWSDAPDQDKNAAYGQLHASLRTVCLLAAPFAPFLPDHLWQRLRRADDPESVHLADYPEAGPHEDADIEEAMRRVRELAEGLRALRAKAGVKTRFPLARATLVVRGDPSATFDELVEILREEVNVKEIERSDSAEAFEATEAKINQRSLGRALKAEAKPVLAALRERSPRDLGMALEAEGKVTVETETGAVEVGAEHFDITTVEREGTVKAESGPYACFLDTELTPELEAEGWAREVVRRIQEMRKEAGCDVEESIRTAIGADDSITRHLETWADYVKGETRSESLELGRDGPGARDWDIDGQKVRISIERTAG